MPPATDGPQTDAIGSKMDKKRSGDAWKGKVIGRFRILSALGKGQMGVVFRAEDKSLSRHVALKILRVPKEDPEKVALRKELFKREARTMATLEHPHVAQIFEVGEDGGYSYLAMELLEGGDLLRAMKAAGPFDPPRACQLIAEATEGIAEAHRVGIVHRDIKPSNLMLSRAGRCKVTDFGLALLEDPNSLFHLPTKVVGTPMYIAPEVARSKPATNASDVYSLGASLWHVLVGEPVFPGGSIDDILSSHVSKPVPDLREMRPELPVRLIELIESCLCKDPADRPTADQLGKALRVFTVPMAAGATGSGVSSGSGSGVTGSGFNTTPVSLDSSPLITAVAPKFVGRKKHTEWLAPHMLAIYAGTACLLLAITIGLVWASTSNMGTAALPVAMANSTATPSIPTPSVPKPHVPSLVKPNPPSKMEAVKTELPASSSKSPDNVPPAEKGNNEEESSFVPAPPIDVAKPVVVAKPVSPPKGKPGDKDDKVIPWDEAAQHVGESITVEGTIVDTRRANQLVFLNFHRDWKDKFYLVVFTSAQKGLDTPAEEMFRAKKVRATGKVNIFKDRPQIEIRKASQIEIVE